MADDVVLPYRRSSDEPTAPKLYMKEVSPGRFAPGVTLVDAAGAPVSGVGPAAVATVTSINDTASSVALLAANANRRGGSIVNNSTSILYILLGTGTASATNFSVAIDGKTTVPGVYFIPPNFTGAIFGVWSADSTGAAIMTELTA
jgi:hypothetical protein